MTESRSQPRTRLAMSAAIITIDARATDIVTDGSMRRGVGLSSLSYGNEEAQTFRTQAHPSDAATHHDQDPRPLGRSHRGEGGARRDHQGRRGGRDRGGRGVEHPRPCVKARRDPQERRTARPQPSREASSQEALAPALLRARARPNLGRSVPMANPVMWFEIIGPDADALHKFYRDALGWKLAPPVKEMGNYAMVEGHEPGIGGGIGGSAGEGSRV